MMRIDPAAWEPMVAHARAAYPDECCGAMLGLEEPGGETPVKRVLVALPLENAYQGPRRSRYELRPEDLIAAEREARERRMTLFGIYHSHPDCEAYFSETDLKNSCPWLSFVVLSIRGGEFDHANCWIPDPDQTVAKKEELEYPASVTPARAEG